MCALATGHHFLIVLYLTFIQMSKEREREKTGCAKPSCGEEQRNHLAHLAQLHEVRNKPGIMPYAGEFFNKRKNVNIDIKLDYPICYWIDFR